MITNFGDARSNVCELSPSILPTKSTTADLRMDEGDRQQRWETSKSKLFCCSVRMIDGQRDIVATLQVDKSRNALHKFSGTNCEFSHIRRSVVAVLGFPTSAADLAAPWRVSALTATCETKDPVRTRLCKMDTRHDTQSPVGRCNLCHDPTVTIHLHHLKASVDWLRGCAIIGCAVLQVFCQNQYALRIASDTHSTRKKRSQRRIRTQKQQTHALSLSFSTRTGWRAGVSVCLCLCLSVCVCVMAPDTVPRHRHPLHLYATAPCSTCATSS